jgi:probable HAF family extracellular repeat protein
MRTKRRHPTQPLHLEQLPERCLLSYSVLDLGTLGGPSSAGEAINNRGEVVGQAATPGGSWAFLWKRGRMYNLGPTIAYGINDRGQVTGGFPPDAWLWTHKTGLQDVGSLGSGGATGLGINDRKEIVGNSGVATDDNFHAFFWKDGHMRDLGTFGEGCNTYGFGINSLSQVVGQSCGRAFVWTESDGIRDLGTLDQGYNTKATAINDMGQIVGSSAAFTLNGTHSVYFTPGEVIDLGTVAGYESNWAQGVNNRGQVVGRLFSWTRSPQFGAFVDDLDTRQMVDLNTLIPPDSGWKLTDARGINDAGEITGTGLIGGQSHAYLLIPDDGNRSVPQLGPTGRRADHGLAAALGDRASDPLPSTIVSISPVTARPADAGPRAGLGERLSGRSPEGTSDLGVLADAREPHAGDPVSAVPEGVGQRVGSPRWLDASDIAPWTREPLEWALDAAHARPTESSSPT